MTAAVPASLETLPEVVLARAREHGDRPAFRWIADCAETGSFDFAGLAARADAIAAQLAETVPPGRRVLLLYPPCLDFVPAFLGVLRAGLTAVPAYPPEPGRAERTRARLEVIARDAGAVAILGLDALRPLVDEVARESALLRELSWIPTDAIARDPGPAPPARLPRADDVAFLQYTSGSTGAPKGVVVRHGSLMANLRTAAAAWRLDARTSQLSWLPLFHDMGLIGCVLLPLFNGAQATLMSPLEFLRDPIAWLRSLAGARAVLSGAPNFGYELCLRRYSESACADLDLSAWRIAFNGAEPVRARTLARFAEVFGRHGFDARAFVPCYGLAEATLFVSGGPPGAAQVLRADSAALAAGSLRAAAADARAADVVSSGAVGPEHEICIVDVGDRTELAEGSVGEIWVRGPSVADGYWNRPDETRAAFGARLADGRGPFLRTGDLGASLEGNLFVTGRAKDLVIVRGRNFYPQDLEASAERGHRLLRAGCCAAFSVDDGDAERLVVAIELARGADARAAGEVAKHVAAAIGEDHAIRPHAVALLEAGTIPKTTSGKIQRGACRAAWLAGSLRTVLVWEDAEPGPRYPDAPLATRAEIERWLRCAVASRVGLRPEDVDPAASTAGYGLDSEQVVALAAELEERLDRPVAPALLFEEPNLARLAERLAPRASERAHDGGLPAFAAQRAPIAIVGIGCRFPGARSPADFWELLRSGGEAIRDVPPDRWDAELLFDDDPGTPGTIVSRRLGLLDDVEGFDALFFGIAPREAARMDPQQRLLLEVAWEAAADAGVPAEALRGTRTGVFVGISGMDHAVRALSASDDVEAHTVTGGAHSMAANRISYAFDLRGPSLAVDTACSSSLVAVHLACESIRRGECGAALAGGVSLILGPEVSIGFTKAGVLAPDGLCKPFDERANGIVRGEGGGLVLLKPLARALADRDRVYAVILGSAVNSDGTTNGITAPSRSAQAAVLRDAYDAAGVDPHRVQYVETHGTGTPLGDAIEASALADCGRARADREPCWIGSVKANVGHLEAAAGIAGLVKTALAVERGAIPPGPPDYRASAAIDLAGSGLAMNDRLRGWPEPAARRLAGVSSFGFGGTNAHIVLASAPTGSQPARDHVPRPEVVALSAPDPATLEARLAAVRARLGAAGAPRDLAAIAFASTARSSQLPERAAFVAESVEELERALAGSPRAPFRARADVRCAKGPAFVFSGLGSQWPAMARSLAEREAVFAASLRACEASARAAGLTSLFDALFDPDRAELLERLEICQPALFSVQVALCALWRSFGLRPAAVVGHSVGEAAAAWAAGALSLDDAMRVVLERSRLLARAQHEGRMAVVAESEEWVRERTARLPDVFVAGANSPRTTLLAGRSEPLGAFVEEMEAEGVFCRHVRGPGFAHCPLAEPISRELERRLHGLAPRAATLPFYSPVTAAPLAGEELGASYWRRNLAEPVRFCGAAERMIADEIGAFVEVSPHPILVGALREIASGRIGAAAIVPSIERDAAPLRTLSESLAALHVAGCPVGWARRFPDRRFAEALPPFPWRRAPAPARARRPAARRGTSRGFLEEHASDAGGPRILAGAVSLERFPWLADHRVEGRALLPTTAYAEIALEAAGAGSAPVEISDLRVERPLFLPDEGEVPLRVRVDDGRDGAREVEILGAADGRAERWIRYARARVRPLDARAAAEPPLDVAALAARLSEPEGAPGHYASLARRGIEYGPAFRGLRKIRRGAGEALADVALADSARGGAHRDRTHPAFLDACLQAIASARVETDDEGLFLPVSVGSIRFLARAGREAVAHATVIERDAASGELEASVRIADRAGRMLGTVDAFRLRRVGGRLASATAVYDVEWKARPPRTGGVPAIPPGLWLLLADRGSAAAALAPHLEKAGAAICSVAREPGCDPVRAAGAAVDRARALAADLGLPLRGVVSLWGLDAPNVADLDGERLAEASALCLEVPCALARALADPEAGSGARLWLGSCGAQPVGEADRIDPVQALAWGLGRSLALEHRDVFGGLVDLDGDPERSGGQVALDLLAPTEDQLVYRGGESFVARLVATAPEPVRPLRCRADGTYLITGGLGDLGLEVARELADRGATRIVLVGRRRLPARAGWEAPRGDTGADRRIAAVRELEARGVTVVAKSADVGDLAAVRALVDELASDLPPIRGVVHAAGVVDPVPADELSAASVAATLRPKVLGAWNLHRALDAAPLDFFVLFSSAAGIWGSQGLAAYGAANHFLDALAYWRQVRGREALSVSWGRWGGVGMAEREGRAAALGTLGVEPMAPAEACERFSELTAGRTPHATVAAVRWETFKPLYEAVAPTRRLLDAIVASDAEEAPPAASGGLRARLRALAPAERRVELADTVRRLLAEGIGVSESELAGATELARLGLDSLLAVRLKARLEARLGLRLPIVILIRNRTIDEIVDELALRVESEGLDEAPVDPEADAVLEPDIAPRPPRGGGGRGVLVTGATGYLGAHLLAELLAREEAADPIVCLVRAPSADEGLERLRAALAGYGLWKPDFAERIEAMPGDLASPRFGLDLHDFARLGRRLGAIHHCGAWLNSVYPYALLRAPNVGGTREVLRLAIAGAPATVHYVSTMAVLPWGRHVPHGELAEREAEELGTLPAGYCEAKWAAERLVLEAGRRGVPVQVFRPGFVSGHSRTGSANPEDLFGRLLRGCVELGVAPALRFLQDMTPVDYASRAIARIAADRPADGAIFHVVNPAPLPWMDLIRWIQGYGHALRTCAYDEWLAALRHAARRGEKNALDPVLALLDRDEGELFAPIAWRCDRTLAALEGTGIACPPAGDALLRTYFGFFERTGVLPPPRRASPSLAPRGVHLAGP